MKLKAAGAEIKLVLVACSDVWMHHKAEEVSGEVRAQEFRESAETLSTEPVQILWMKDSVLDAKPLSMLVGLLDKELAEFAPDVLFIPEPSYHQDHQYVNRACVAALRPTGRHQPSKVMSYEVPTSTGIGSPPFSPNHYVVLGEEIDHKINLFRDVYRSQFTEGERGALAGEGIRRHAMYRGSECGARFAEAFVLLREVVR